MKLYIPCAHCKRQMLLNVKAPTKNNLRYHFGGEHFNATCGNCGYSHTYRVSDVQALADSGATPGGAIAGGLIGLVGGPLGMLIGGIVGGAVGNANDAEAQRKANVFNQSR